MGKKRLASDMLRIRVAPDEKVKIEALAEAEDLTVSAYVRQAIGLPVLERGGAQPGAGRPPKNLTRET